MRQKVKTPPMFGTIVSSIWKHTVVNVSVDTFSNPNGLLPPTYNIFESAKFKTLEQATAYRDEMNKRNAEYAKQRGYAKPRHEYYLAMWMMNSEGEIVCQLMETPTL